MGLPPANYVETDGLHGVGPVHNGAPGQGQGLALAVPNGNGAHLPPCGVPAGAEGVRAISIPEEKSFLAQIADSSNFQNITLGVIVLNGLWIGIDVQANHPKLEKNGKAPLEPVSTVVENLFCLYFTFEILVRLFAYPVKKNCTDISFLFDTTLVIFMVLETWVLVIVEKLVGGGGDGVLSKFSCLRLMRLTRLTRILKSLPELATLVKGMVSAARAVSVVLIFMLLVLYVFAIVFTAQIGDHKDPAHTVDPYWVRDADPLSIDLFGSMGGSMMTLFTRGVLGDNLGETLIAIKDTGAWSSKCVFDKDPESLFNEDCRGKGELWLMWVFLVFMVLSAFCLLNMLVGVLCDTIASVADSEHEAINVNNVRTKIEACFMALDVEGRDNTVTKTEWEKMKDDPIVRKSFLGIGLEESNMDVELARIEENLFGAKGKGTLLVEDETSCQNGEAHKDKAKQDEELTLEQFVDKLLEIRPDAAASFLDFEVLNSRTVAGEIELNAQLDIIEAALAQRTLAQGSPPAQQALPPPQGAPPPLQPVPVDGSVPEGSGVLVARPIEEPKVGTSSDESWLQGLPKEVLFAELARRELARRPGGTVLQQTSSAAATYVD